MTYTEAQYVKSQITNDIVAIRCNINGMLSTVPIDPDNCDYQLIMSLVEEGELVVADPLPNSNNMINT